MVFRSVLFYRVRHAAPYRTYLLRTVVHLPPTFSAWQRGSYVAKVGVKRHQFRDYQRSTLFYFLRLTMYTVDEDIIFIIISFCVAKVGELNR